MFVVDYLRRTNGPTIVIPSFHTGPIGLLPETEVHVALMEGNAGFEVVIRPFQSSADNIMQLSCTMTDRPGVVGRLIAAVSELGINVVNEVTSSIDHQNFHRVDVLLDWTTSKFPKRTASSTRVRRHYRDFHSIFPIGIQRNVELFESIMAHCDDVILREHVNGVSTPVISLREVQTPTYLQPYGQVTVNRHTNRAYHVEIDLPAPLVTRLRLKLKMGNEPLHYILLSETDTRTLRAFFPRKEVLGRLVHLGFFHVDVPGALSSILAPLARADFNIVTSLLRQNKDGRNVWEAVLEYRGKRELPVHSSDSQSNEVGEELCLWATHRVLEAVSEAELDRLVECDLQIGLPRYPRRSWEGRVALRALARDVVGTGRVVGHEPGVAQAMSTQSGMIEFIKRARIEATPSIFLSYPRAARSHAELIRNTLSKRYKIVDYQEPDSEVIVDQVVQRIESCDYFIGVWRPEAESRASISPWLHFEYGVAVAAGKKTMIVHSEDLDPRVWKRINPGIAQPEFCDLYFESRAVPQIDAYCREHFRDDGTIEEAFISLGEGTSRRINQSGT